MNNKCVYTHKLDGNVVYVGSGNINRARSKNCRSVEHLLIWDDLEIEIIRDNLYTTEATELEQELINKHWYSGLLLNKNKKVYTVNKLIFEDLDKVLYYDESSPTFLRWKVSISKKFKAGITAGRIDNCGYARVIFKGKKYKVHRIILVLNTGEDIPDGMVVDHIDGNKTNNSINNLRIVSQADNSKNKKHKSSNTGLQCIHEDKDMMRLVVSFMDFQRNRICFSYHDKPVKSNKKHYPTREQALEAALAYRNSLVDQGLIILTNKEETKWQ